MFEDDRQRRREKHQSAGEKSCAPPEYQRVSDRDRRRYKADVFRHHRKKDGRSQQQQEPPPAPGEDHPALTGQSLSSPEAESEREQMPQDAGRPADLFRSRQRRKEAAADPAGCPCLEDVQRYDRKESGLSHYDESVGSAGVAGPLRTHVISLSPHDQIRGIDAPQQVSDQRADEGHPNISDIRHRITSSRINMDDYTTTEMIAARKIESR